MSRMSPMSRIRDAVVVSARAVRRMPLPRSLYTGSASQARRSLPGGAVQKRHAIDVEMIGRTRGVWLDRHLAEQGIIVHLHGGAFVSGPFGGDWEWLSAQADARGCAGLMIDYRRAPDHQHPVALEDVEAVLVELADVLRTHGWVLAGHNAGGGLATAIAARIRDGRGDMARVPAPGALILMAPWMDLELSTAGMTETEQRDFPHERRLLSHAARAYAGRTPLSDPMLSPVNGNLAGLPPIHLSVGAGDLLHGEAKVLRLQLEEAGDDVSYREVPGRLWTLYGMRKGEAMQRLLDDQQRLIATALEGSARSAEG